MTGIWENEFLSEAAAAMYEMNADDIIRQQCRAREEYIRHENYVKQKLEELEQENAEQKEALEAKDHALASQESVIAEQKQALEAREHALTEKDSQLEQYQKRIQELEAQLTRTKTK